MKEYKLTVRAPNYVKGVYYFFSEERAEHEKKKWVRKGYYCTVEEVRM